VTVSAIGGRVTRPSASRCPKPQVRAVVGPERLQKRLGERRRVTSGISDGGEDDSHRFRPGLLLQGVDEVVNPRLWWRCHFAPSGPQVKTRTASLQLRQREPRRGRNWAKGRPTGGRRGSTARHPCGPPRQGYVVSHWSFIRFRRLSPKDLVRRISPVQLLPRGLTRQLSVERGRQHHWDTIGCRGQPKHSRALSRMII